MRWTPGLDAALDERERSSMTASAKFAHARSAQPLFAAGLAARVDFVAGLVAGFVGVRRRVAGFAGASAVASAADSLAADAACGLVVRVRVVRAFGFAGSPDGSPEALSDAAAAPAAGAAVDLVVRVRRAGLTAASGASAGCEIEACGSLTVCG